MCRVHAHVERAVRPEAETARRIVELGRGDAEVEEHATNARMPLFILRRMCGHDRREVGKWRVDERKPHFVGKALEPSRDGFAILVDREHTALSTQGREKACRVAAAPERRIDIVTTRNGRQRRERFLDEHRRVLIHEMLSTEAG
jgi:hypothetical protein